ncbi:MAG: hypothetical protein JWQ66_817 [Mucilaginibacter sp.]|nr:hypothetical protein [Mucilaginibacter sp.]
MKTLLNRWFVICCLIWLIVITARKLGHPFPFINGYINDAVAIPVMASLGLWFQRVFMIRNNYYVLAPWHVIFIVVYVTLIFEILLPHFSKTYTADWADALLYMTGGLFFYKVINMPISPKNQ